MYADVRRSSSESSGGSGIRTFSARIPGAMLAPSARARVEPRGGKGTCPGREQASVSRRRRRAAVLVRVQRREWDSNLMRVLAIGLVVMPARLWRSRCWGCGLSRHARRVFVVEPYEPGRARRVRCVAEGVGFEPTGPRRAQQFSRLPPSSARPSLQEGMIAEPRSRRGWDLNPRDR